MAPPPDIDRIGPLGAGDGIRPVDRVLPRRDRDRSDADADAERRRNEREHAHRELRRRMLAASIDDLEHVPDVVLYDEQGRASSHIGGTAEPDSAERRDHLARVRKRFDATA